ncbi:hypothetical protein [Geodermatophilus sabuli]|uniref:Wadjet protein JetD C-terminal domain-containing protein n=1 Tax=Geodermatophilus sabuli TaxID=1564158 RepID=A0A285EEN7_9ACTN|nr:hypothetical protein [Geodermatophilus sabuli]MBB3084192.1 broad specificity phosphatase PhoE [Geodermatophilus sabuli]SNX96536.1 hypothetical protein SAMN06893097_104251 [Geodermatophilus sabuli]
MNTDALPSPALSPLAAHLSAVVVAHRRQTVDLDVLYRAAVDFDRSLATSVTGRQELLDALIELDRGDIAALPRGREHFDRRSTPPLPQWVRRPSAGRRTAPEGRTRVWPSALQPAAAMARRPDEFTVLDVVAEFLRRGGADRISVPVRERSLELFGDEKRLDTLLASRLFTSHALTLELLRCHPVPMPFAAQWVPGAPTGEVTLLVAENHHTYASLLEATRAHAAAGGSARWVGYGGGQQFCSSVASVPLLVPVPTRIQYFGDLDLRGLEIPTMASATATAAGLPPVQPVMRLYTALLAHGRKAPAIAVAESAAGAAAAWLGPLAGDAAAVLTGGHRLAQEAVGLELLLEHPEWLLDQPELGSA